MRFRPYKAWKHWLVLTLLIAPLFLRRTTGTPSNDLATVVSDWPLLLVDALITGTRAIIGLLLAVVTAILLGSVIVVSKRFRRWFDPLLSFLRSLPSTALIALGLLYVHPSNLSWLVVWFGCAWPILVTIRDGWRNIPLDVSETVTLLDLSRGRALKRVYAPLLLRDLLTGVRVSLGIALILAVSVELVKSDSSLFGYTSDHFLARHHAPQQIGWGLGGYLAYWREQFAAVPMLAAITLAGVLGTTINVAFDTLRRRLLTSLSLTDEGRRKE